MPSLKLTIRSVLKKNAGLTSLPARTNKSSECDGARAKNGAENDALALKFVDIMPFCLAQRRLSVASFPNYVGDTSSFT